MQLHRCLDQYYMQYNCLKALDDRECRYVRLFAMDFAKAFDNIEHSILCDKLKAFNLIRIL